MPCRGRRELALELHLSELLDEPLVALDVPRLAAHQQHLLEHGRSANTVREAMTRLSGILQVAVEHGHVPGKPRVVSARSPLIRARRSGRYHPP